MGLSGVRQNTAALTYNASPMNIAAKMNSQPIDMRVSDAPGIQGWPCGQSDWWHGASISGFHTGLLILLAPELRTIRPTSRQPLTRSVDPERFDGPDVAV